MQHWMAVGVGACCGTTLLGSRTAMAAKCPSSRLRAASPAPTLLPAHVELLDVVIVDLCAVWPALRPPEVLLHAAIVAPVIAQRQHELDAPVAGLEDHPVQRLEHVLVKLA